jgi:hypothetical protein
LSIVRIVRSVQHLTDIAMSQQSDWRTNYITAAFPNTFGQSMG